MEPLTKACTKCKIEKEFTFFAKSKRQKSGICLYCKECANAYMRAYKSKPEQKEKERLRCKEYKSKNREKIITKNREKIITKNREYNQLHKEEATEKRKEYRQQNLESIRAKERLHHAENKDSLNEKSRNNRAKNKDLYRETNKIWYQKNKERVRKVSNAYRKTRNEFFNAIAKEYRKRNPEKCKRHDADRIKNITDGYIINIISQTIRLSAAQRSIINEEAINIKRLNIQLKRELKKQKQ